MTELPKTPAFEALDAAVRDCRARGITDHEEQLADQKVQAVVNDPRWKWEIMRGVTEAIAEQHESDLLRASELGYEGAVARLNAKIKMHLAAGVLRGRVAAAKEQK